MRVRRYWERISRISFSFFSLRRLWGYKQATVWYFSIAFVLLIVISMMMPERPGAQIYFPNEADYSAYMLIVMIMVAFYSAGWVMVGQWLTVKKHLKNKREVNNREQDTYTSVIP